MLPVRVITLCKTKLTQPTKPAVFVYEKKSPSQNKVRLNQNSKTIKFIFTAMFDTVYNRISDFSSNTQTACFNVIKNPTEIITSQSNLNPFSHPKFTRYTNYFSLGFKSVLHVKYTEVIHYSRTINYHV